MRRILLVLLMVVALWPLWPASRGEAYYDWKSWWREYFPEVIDVEGHWAYEDIMTFLTNDFVRVTKGFREPGEWFLFIDQQGRFRPSLTLTRAEFVQFLYPVIKPGATDTSVEIFDDVDDHWVSTGYLERALKEGVINPSDYADKRFQPDRTITRLEVAIIAVRYKARSLLSSKDGEVTVQDVSQKVEELLEQNNTEPIPFSDSQDIPNWAEPYVQAARQLGLLRGYPDGTFRPYQELSRAEAAVLVTRLIY